MTREEVYSIIARMTGYTFEQISRMNPHTQYVLISGKSPSDKTQTFATMEEYQQWRLRRGG